MISPSSPPPTPRRDRPSRARSRPRRRAASGALRLALLAAFLLGFPPAAALAHGSAEDALARITGRIREDPDNARLYLLRGEIYRDERAWAAAEADFRRAAQRDPRDPDVALCLGRLFLDASRPADAEAALSRFLAQRPGDPLGHALRARALSALHRRREAAAAYARAIALHPEPPAELYLERADALAAGDEPRLAEALETLDAGLRRLGEVPPLALRAVALELRAGNVDGAVARLDRLAASSPRKDAWLARKARILERAGRGPDARGAYGEVLAALGSLPPARRATRASRDLEAEARAALARLDAGAR